MVQTFYHGDVRVPAQDLPLAIVRSLGGYPRSLVLSARLHVADVVVGKAEENRGSAEEERCSARGQSPRSRVGTETDCWEYAGSVP